MVTSAEVVVMSGSTAMGVVVLDSCPDVGGVAEKVALPFSVGVETVALTSANDVATVTFMLSESETFTSAVETESVTLT